MHLKCTPSPGQSYAINGDWFIDVLLYQHRIAIPVCK